ncbi:putative pantothenate transporter [Xylariales sp. AK1849]|nr:putative pantothenate transporter [Xylariales sp. AK1849]
MTMPHQVEDVEGGIPHAPSQLEEPKRELLETENVKSRNGFAENIEDIPQTEEEKKAERRFVLKIDLMVLPLLVMSVLMASLVRGDVGYAYNSGMEDELQVGATSLSIIISMFYVGYFVMSFPGTLFLKKLGGNVQIGIALCAWGTFTTLMCVATSWQTLAGLRLLIGCGEALNQAAGLYLTFFYKRNQLATRGAYYFGVFAFAGSLNGLLAFGISSDLDGVGEWKAWRWIFFIEGLMAVFWGFVVLCLLPSSPEKLRWGFSDEEKKIALRRYRQNFNTENDTKIRGAQVLKVLKDPHPWVYVFFFAGLVSLIIGYASDRLQRRGILLIGCYSVAIIGCTYPPVVLTQAWYGCNIIGYTKRATVTALFFMCGQAFSIAASYAYSDPPYYYRGNGFTLGFTALALVLTIVQIKVLKKKNRAKLNNKDSPEAEALRLLHVEEIQEDHPDFMYYL